MKHTSVSVLVLVFLSALLFSCGGKKEQAKITPAATPKQGEPDITVTGAERMPEMYEHREAGGYGPKQSSPTDASFKGHPGNEFVVVHLDVKAPGGAQQFNIDNPLLYDSGGKEYPSIAERIKLTGLEQNAKKADIPFEVPQGTQLKTLKFGDYSFDLQKLSIK